MPEGHTIHRIAQDHCRWFSRQKQRVFSPQGRFEKEATVIDGKVLREVSAHGKHLFYHWNRNLILHVHLGLYGKFRVHKNPAPEPRGAVRMRMIGKVKSFDLNGPNRCELLDQEAYQQLRARLGEDPLRQDAEPESAWSRFQSSRSPIGSLLLDQSVIAGIGNIYRAEILFLLGIHPKKPANQIHRTTFYSIWDLATELLRIGVQSNKIITTGVEKLDARPSRQVERLNIYKRKRCPDCDTAVRNIQLANRKLYYCHHCQAL